MAKTVRPAHHSGAGILVGAVLAVAAPALGADVVRLGDVTTLSNGALYVAIEKGYMKEQGIEIVAETFSGAAKMTSSLASGDLDVGTGTPSAGLFNALAQGTDIKAVADKGQVRSNYIYQRLFGRKDLVEGGQIRSFKDYKGRKIASLAKGNVQDYAIGKMLEHEGLAFKDVEIVYLTAPQTLQALAAKAVDGAHMVEPWVSRALGENLIAPVGDLENVPALRQYQVAVILYGGKFIRERRPAAQRFMNAYGKGIEYITRNGWQDDGVVDAIAKHTKVERSLVRRAVPAYIAPDGRPDVASMSRFQDWLHEQGMVTVKVPMEQVVDLSFLPPPR